MSLLKAWRSSGMNLVRNVHKSQKGYLIAACNGCPYRTTEINKLLDGDK